MPSKSAKPSTLFGHSTTFDQIVTFTAEGVKWHQPFSTLTCSEVDFCLATETLLVS